MDSFSGNETRGISGHGPGTALGFYELREPLGRGGMGQVWKAFDKQGQRAVAIKTLPPEFRDNQDAMAQIREAFNVTHALTHQHIGKTIGLMVEPGVGPYIVMDLVPGRPLSQLAREYRSRGPMTVEIVVRLLRPVAEALDYAHGRGILHRDIKPENILVSMRDDHAAFDVTLIDFGLAAEIRSSMSRYTTGKVDTSGTRPYMSPEQLRGKAGRWDARTDQYSLAVVAYELLAGHLPFSVDDEMAQMLAVLNEPVDPIPSQPQRVNDALMKALAKEREQRFQTCVEFVSTLAEVNAALPPFAASTAAVSVPSVTVPAFPASTSPASASPDWGIDDEIVSCVIDGRRLEAIKLYRSRVNSDLLKAKDVITALEGKLRLEGKMRFAETKAHGGCLSVVLFLALGSVSTWWLLLS